MLIRILVLLSAVSIMTGCGFGSQPIKVAKPILPASMAQGCETLPLPISGKLKDLLQNHVETMEVYHECAARHDSTVEWINNTVK